MTCSVALLARQTALLTAFNNDASALPSQATLVSKKYSLDTKTQKVILVNE